MEPVASIILADRAAFAALGTGSDFMRVRSIYRVSHKIVERALTYREDHLPAMDGAAIAGERHALVEGFIALRAGEHEAKLTLRDEVEDRSCIVLLHAGAAILGERRSGPVVGGEDVQLGAAVAGAKDANIFVPRPDVVAKHVAGVLEREAEAGVVIGCPRRASADTFRRASRYRRPFRPFAGRHLRADQWAAPHRGRHTRPRLLGLSRCLGPPQREPDGGGQRKGGGSRGRKGPSLPLRLSGPAHESAIIGCPRIRIGERHIGLAHLLEALLPSVIAHIDVGMEAPRQGPERSLHLLAAGVLGQPQYVVERAHRKSQRTQARAARDTRTTHAPPATTQACQFGGKEAKRRRPGSHFLVCGSSPGCRIAAASVDLPPKAAGVPWSRRPVSVPKPVDAPVQRPPCIPASLLDLMPGFGETTDKG